MSEEMWQEAVVTCFYIPSREMTEESRENFHQDRKFLAHSSVCTYACMNVCMHIYVLDLYTVTVMDIRRSDSKSQLM
jgi:hypothetical protein